MGRFPAGVPKAPCGLPPSFMGPVQPPGETICHPILGLSGWSVLAGDGGEYRGSGLRDGGATWPTCSTQPVASNPKD